MTAIIVVILRVVGLIWAIGAVFIMKNARASGGSASKRLLHCDVDQNRASRDLDKSMGWKAALR